MANNRINLITSSQEELEQLLQNTKLGQTKKKIIEDRILILKLRELVFDTYWDDAGQSPFGSITPDTIKSYRRILTDISDRTLDESKLDEMKTIALSKQEKDQQLPSLPNDPLDDYDGMNKKISNYLTLKRMIARKLGIEYLHKMKPEEVNNALDEIQKDIIYPRYAELKEMLATIKPLVDSPFWNDKSPIDSDAPKHNYTPRFIIEMREILGTNTITQRNKVAAIEEAIKTYATNESHLAIRPFISAISNMLGGQSVNTYQATLNTYKTRIKNSHAARSTQDVNGILNTLGTIFNDPIWNTKGKGFLCMWTKLPHGIEKVRKILKKIEDNKLTPETGLEKIFQLMRTKHFDHTNRYNSTFSINPDHQLTGVYARVHDLSNAWYGRLDGTNAQTIDEAVQAISNIKGLTKPVIIPENNFNKQKI